MEKRTVYLWGFRAEEVGSWPADLEPVATMDWPSGAPVIVHADAAERFQAEAVQHLLPDGRLPDAILYLPHGTEAPTESWAYFDAAVAAGDWQALRALLACPRRFQLAQMADNLSVAFVWSLGDHVEELRIEQLPLPEDSRAHLAACHTCREAFSHSLEGRLWVRRKLQRETSTANAPVRGWLEVPLRSVAEGILAGVTGEIRHVFEVLATLVSGCVEQQLIPVGAFRSFRAEGRNWQLNTLRSLLEGVYEGEPVRLHRSRRELTIGWDKDHKALWIDGLLGDESAPVKDFRIEVWRGETKLWDASSQQGKVWLPPEELEKLEQALQAGADQLIIHTKK